VTLDREPRRPRRTAEELQRLAETYGRCPECHEPLAAQLTYPTGQPVTAVYVCTGCGKRQTPGVDHPWNG
jgi:uncharacterized protein with PIN domain